MKKCYCCGAKIEQDNAAFCPKCGKPLEVTVELTRRAAAGDSDAQTELYYRTYAAVYARIRSKVPDDDTAMDLMQDTYLRAFSHLEQLNEPAAFPGWILTIARNLTINWYKKHSKEKNTALFSESEFENEANLSAEDDESASTEYRIDFMPEESLDRVETARLVSEILDELPEEQKIVLLMRYTDEMSTEEIAEALGISPNTVKTRLLRAKKKVEAKVLELERKGTKLYSLAPLPFLLFLLGNLENQAPNISATQVLGTGAAAGASASATAGTATTTAAASTGTTAATTATATAGGVATKGLAVKIIAALLAVALVGGGGAAAYSAYSQAKQAEEDARAAEMLAEEEAQRQAEEEAQRLAEEAEAEAAEEVVQVAPPTAEVMEEMLGAFDHYILEMHYRPEYDVVFSGDVTSNVAIEIAALAICESSEFWANGDYTVVSVTNGTVDSTGAEVIFPDRDGQWVLAPSDMLKTYLRNLFGSSYELSDFTYSSSGYTMLDSSGQIYFIYGDYGVFPITTVVNISETASEDGGFDVLMLYQDVDTDESRTVLGEEYILYHVMPDEASDYGWIIVSMTETDETGTATGTSAEATASTTLEWAELYADYLEIEENDGYGEYYLIYLNNDDIPEILFDGVSTADASTLYYIQDNQVEAEDLYYLSPIFSEKGGYIESSMARMGTGVEEVLYLDEDSNLLTIFIGEIDGIDGLDSNGNTVDSTYIANGVNVTENEYNSLYEKAISWMDEEDTILVSPSTTLKNFSTKEIEGNLQVYDGENWVEYPEYMAETASVMISYLRSLTN